MKKLFICILFIRPLMAAGGLVGCPGIPVLCQFDTNKWAEYDLLPALRDLNKLIRDRLSKLENIKQLATRSKFQEVIHEDAELLIRELRSPSLYKNAFNKLQSEPERRIEKDKVINAIQGIIKAYDYIGQHGTLNLGPLNAAIKKYQPILEKTEKDIDRSRKANFEVIIPTKEPSCNDFLFDPQIACKGYAAFNLPVWINLDTCKITIHSAKTQSKEHYQKQFDEQIEHPTAESFSKATSSPTREEFETAIEENK